MGGGGGGQRNFADIVQRSRGDKENLGLKIGDRGGEEGCDPTPRSAPESTHIF